MFSRTARKARRQSRQPAARPMDDPYYQGDAAFHDCKTHADCPYVGGDDAIEWLQGFNDATARE